MLNKLARSLLDLSNILAGFSFLINQLNITITNILNELLQLLVGNTPIPKNIKTNRILVLDNLNDRTFYSMLTLLSIKYADRFIIKIIKNMDTLGWTNV